MMLLLLEDIRLMLLLQYLVDAYILYECILTMLGIHRDSNVLRGDRRLLIEIVRRGLGWLIRDDDLLVQ